MRQADLFGFEPRPSYPETPGFVRGSETSKAASLSMEHRASSVRELVFGYIRSCGGYGSTDEEMREALDLSPNTARPRRCELMEMGRVRDSGRTRTGASGRKCVVWVTA